MRVVVRAFTSQGYHRDILVMSERQVHMTNDRVKEPLSSAWTGLLGVGGQINPKDFPEVEYFEVVIDHETK